MCVPLLAIDRRAVLYGKVFSDDGSTRALRVQVIGKDDHALTVELTDGEVHTRGARLGLDGLGFLEVMAVVRTRGAGGDRVYLRLCPSVGAGG